MCLKALRMFVPTARRLVLFAVFALAPLLGLLDILPPLKVFFGLPHVLIFDYATSLVVQIIYSYLLACIYAAAYVSIEASLRKNVTRQGLGHARVRRTRPHYPLMTYGAWKKRREKPVKPARKQAGKVRRRKKKRT
ncbi:MAG: hypothetical protein FJY76_01225 [Candidatus Aenigmarchaeota archaeon]|nr:hypothetical protein [Candidatus Aenigmarchaeota archaeon]